VGGRREDLDRVEQEVLAQFPRKRAVRLKTEGAFHTYLMVGAARHFRAILEQVDIAPPNLRVLSNYTGGYHDPDPEAIKSRLFFQLFHPVKWIWNLETVLRDGVTLFIEFGGGIGAGETPDAKRPNLESILKKAMRRSRHSAQYYSVINNRTARESAEAIRKGV
jgi:[acyl-carrier-protein] S-malonyltransferase